MRDEDLSPLQQFTADYPMAKTFLLHPGKERRHQSGVEIVPLAYALLHLAALLRGESV